jgi:hypothetical protein
MTIHVKALQDLTVMVEDVLSGTVALRPTVVSKDKLVFPDVSTDGSFRGHIHWYAVTAKDANGQCRWGDADVPSLDGSTVVEVSATSTVPGKLPCT